MYFLAFDLWLFGLNLPISYVPAPSLYKKNKKKVSQQQFVSECWIRKGELAVFNLWEIVLLLTIIYHYKHCCLSDLYLHLILYLYQYQFAKLFIYFLFEVQQLERMTD